MGKTIADQYREEGLKKGLTRGKAEGRAEGRAELLLRLLAKRFGQLTPSVESRVRAASGDEIDRWAERLLTATTPDELLA